MPAVGYGKTRFSAIWPEFSGLLRASKYIKLKHRAEFGVTSGPAKPLQNGKNEGLPVIFVTSRQNDDEDTLRSQRHQISELGTV